jgi:hypothetical protein
VARQAGVPIFRDVPLARALEALDEGGEIPAALYEAVAEILRVVYQDGAADGAGEGAGLAEPPAAQAVAAPVLDAGARGGAWWKRV